MTRPKIRDMHEITRQIMDGEVDDQLEWIDQALRARKHDLYRPGRQVKLLANAGEIAGQTGTIIKVNAKRITVGFGENAWGFEREFNVPLTMLELID